MVSRAHSSNLFGEEATSPLGGEPLAFVEVGTTPDVDLLAPLRIAVDRTGVLPQIDSARFDALVTVRANAPAPWVSVVPQRLEAQLAKVAAQVAAAPVAATMLARMLRIGENLKFEDALTIESLAYSTLLGGSEFAAWRARNSDLDPGYQVPSQVRYGREGDDVTLTLASPDNRNAMTVAMRDALWEALANVLEDPTLPMVTIRADGRCFSTGGHLPEFGSASDLAAAHVIRMRRSAALLLHRLGARATIRLHGACIGSGIEVPAAAAYRIAARDTVIQLPELRMGLIPGAGGTVTVARAIGRHRMLWLVLGAFRLGAAQALDWGLVSGLEP